VRAVRERRDHKEKTLRQTLLTRLDEERGIVGKVKLLGVL